jgi:DNA-binding HxlR family transcriptional regulator
MDITLFVNITSRAWALPVLSCLHDGVAGRQAPLLKATGASRTAFSQSVDHLIKLELLERNPGYGHPLRPEFRLTSFGKSIAALSHSIQRISPQTDHDLLRRSWTLPVLTTLQTPNHFNDIKRQLGTITDRALSQSLKTMEDRQWVSRTVDYIARPPKPIYTAVNTGAHISQITGPKIVFAP